MPVYIGKSGDLVGWHRCLTHWHTDRQQNIGLLSFSTVSSLSWVTQFLPCNANHDSRFLLIFLQLVDIKEPSVLVESVLWTQYSLQYESNHPCSRSVWQSCVSICYFQIVLQSANKTGCLRRWWGSPSCSSSAPAPLPQHYKRRPSVMSPPR